MHAQCLHVRDIIDNENQSRQSSRHETVARPLQWCVALAVHNVHIRTACVKQELNDVKIPLSNRDMECCHVLIVSSVHFGFRAQQQLKSLQLFVLWTLRTKTQSLEVDCLSAYPRAPIKRYHHTTANAVPPAAKCTTV